MSTFLHRLPLLLLLLLPAAPLRGDAWDFQYDRAMKAMEQRQWVTAIRHLQNAVKSRPQPSLRARVSGVDMIEYLPYFHMGKAYFMLGDYTMAQANLQKSLEYGAVKGAPARLQELQTMLAECRRQTVPETEPPAAPAPVESSAAAIQSHIAAADAARAAGDLEKARGEYQMAREGIEKSGELRPLAAGLEQKIQEIDRAMRVNALLARAESAWQSGKGAEAERLLAELHGLDPANARADRLAGEIQAARRPPPAPQTQLQFTELLQRGREKWRQGRLEEARQNFAVALGFAPDHAAARSLLRQVEEALLTERINAAVAAYFHGDSARAWSELRAAWPQAEKSAVPGLPARVCQFLAVIAIENALLAGESVETPDGEAVRWVKRLLGREPNADLDETYFSPRTVAIFRSLRRSRP